jgi:hypothetical protein
MNSLICIRGSDLATTAYGHTHCRPTGLCNVHVGLVGKGRNKVDIGSGEEVPRPTCCIIYVYTPEPRMHIGHLQIRMDQRGDNDKNEASARRNRPPLAQEC